MDIEFSKSFEKQTSQIKDKVLLNRLSKLVKRVMKCQSLTEIPNLKPMVGYAGFYRIRIGEYRIGISLEDKTVWFLFFGKRDESTYKRFP
jgi:mRNA interferase RelE/StbE